MILEHVLRATVAFALVTGVCATVLSVFSLTIAPNTPTGVGIPIVAGIFSAYAICHACLTLFSGHPIERGLFDSFVYTVCALVVAVFAFRNWLRRTSSDRR